MKSRHQLRREIAERSAALTARQLQWQSERAEQQRQRRAALVSPRWLAGSFAAGLALGLLGGRRRQAHAEPANAEATAEPSLLLRTARDLLPVVQPLLLSAALQWWQLRQRHDDGDDHLHDESSPP
jgi:hypothetical protein